MTQTHNGANFAPGTLVSARGREWVVLPESEPDLLVVRPLGGGTDDTAAILPALEEVRPARFQPPTSDDLGDAASARLLRSALRLGFRSTVGPFRSLASIAVEPRSYQYVPLMMALRQSPVRLLVADDVGIGKTIEAGLIVTELLAQGDAQRLAVLCSPALAEQWQNELRTKFAIDAELVLPSTTSRLTKGLLLTESLFERYPYVVVSTDFIKSPTRRQEFINHCPDLVIVDEAHTAVADGLTHGARTQRYDLMKRLAADPERHLLLLTATPHSGKEEGFRNLIGLLDPELANLDLEQVSSRERLARHFVQRRRADIRRYLDEETLFPKDREPSEVAYELSPDYRTLFEQVIDYAREQVVDADGHGVRQRVRWWAALALLRSLASSPAAAAATLRTRAQAAEAVSLEEVDSIGRATVLDTAADETAESADIVAGADDLDADESTDGAAWVSNRRRLLTLAKKAEELAGPKGDRKLATITAEVRRLLADGYDPIVFCRFIPTAGYVAAHLAGALGKDVHVAAVTGELPPSERIARIDTLTANEGRHVLVATDCLSEGVNLQEHFQAVVHYDLAWSPTRHEQREGRVDRFGQRSEIVRAVTIYGVDNQIDGIVLDVLLRKHRAISKATGVAVPVPDQSDSVVEALMEGLILRGQSTQQLTLDLGLEQKRDSLHSEWDAAARREVQSRTKYAQAAIKPEEVQREVSAARDALGNDTDVEGFLRDVLRALGGTVTDLRGLRSGFEAVTTNLPIGLRDALPPAHREPLPFHRSHPVPRHEALISRTDPHVEAVARYVLDLALDPAAVGPEIRRPARRASVIRTKAVDRRTTLLITRMRFHLELPGTAEHRSTVTEDARLVGFEGAADAPVWLDDDRVRELAAIDVAANIAPEHAADALHRTLGALEVLGPDLDDMASRVAEETLAAHRRVRTGAGAARRGLAIRPETPVDIIGIYVFLPDTTAGVYT